MDWDLIHPKARTSFMRLEEDLTRAVLASEVNVWFRPFSGYRSPMDQIDLVRRGVSKAGPFQSAHNYGLAVDFVPFDDERKIFHWPDAKDACWDYLDRRVTQMGLLRPISWDRPHVEHPLWRVVKDRLV